jgi:hypothetical protein
LSDLPVDPDHEYRHFLHYLCVPKLKAASNFIYNERRSGVVFEPAFLLPR